MKVANEVQILKWHMEIWIMVPFMLLLFFDDYLVAFFYNQKILTGDFIKFPIVYPT